MDTKDNTPNSLIMIVLSPAMTAAVLLSTFDPANLVSTKPENSLGP
jgi:hypothetical protein